MPNPKLTTREKLTLIIEEMENAGNIMTISDVAKEVERKPSLIHNRYPDLAERIRNASGVVKQNDVKAKLTKRLGTIKMEKDKHARVRKELEAVKAELRKSDSVNAALQLENSKLKALNQKYLSKLN